MTKAERRKRARQRARERERAAATVEATPNVAPVEEGVASLSVASTFAEPEPAVRQPATPTESEFITGPIVPRVPGPVRIVKTLETPAAALAPSAPTSELGGDDDDGDDGEIELGGEDDEGEDIEGEGDDDEPLDEEDALFNLACAALEEGDALSWNEVVTWVLAAEVEDPRLALVVALLVTEDGGTEMPKLTGARLLSKMEELGLGDIATEARETVAAVPEGEGDSPEERAVVRTNARELQAQAKRELAPRADRPRKASELKSAGGRATR